MSYIYLRFFKIAYFRCACAYGEEGRCVWHSRCGGHSALCDQCLLPSIFIWVIGVKLTRLGHLPSNLNDWQLFSMKSWYHIKLLKIQMKTSVLEFILQNPLRGKTHDFKIWSLFYKCQNVLLEDEGHHTSWCAFKVICGQSQFTC